VKSARAGSSTRSRASTRCASAGRPQRARRDADDAGGLRRASANTPPRARRQARCWCTRRSSRARPASTTACTGRRGRREAEPARAGLPDGTRHGQASEGYHGYYYKLLTGAGPARAGRRATTTWSSGKLFGGFAVMAWPARYQDTGVKSFIVNHDGRSTSATSGRRARRGPRRRRSSTRARLDEGVAIERSPNEHIPDAQWLRDAARCVPLACVGALAMAGCTYYVPPPTTVPVTTDHHDTGQLRPLVQRGRRRPERPGVHHHPPGSGQRRHRRRARATAASPPT
jgi:hypothetical protein